jgi:hypothetical protein
VSLAPRPAWRVFPWDPEAEEGAPFSASFVPAAQGWGRFDRPGEPAGVLYLAEGAEHAVAEKLQDLRNQSLEDSDLIEYGHRLALAQATLEDEAFEGIADLCDPQVLARLGIAPDEIAAASRGTTRAIAERLHAEGFTGLRWWSAFMGEWHTLVLFLDRMAAPSGFSSPEALRPDHPALRDAAGWLNIQLP